MLRKLFKEIIGKTTLANSSAGGGGKHPAIDRRVYEAVRLYIEKNADKKHIPKNKNWFTETTNSMCSGLADYFRRAAKNPITEKASKNRKTKKALEKTDGNVLLDKTDDKRTLEKTDAKNSETSKRRSKKHQKSSDLIDSDSSDDDPPSKSRKLENSNKQVKILGFLNKQSYY